jgi:hypothetical protein
LPAARSVARNVGPSVAAPALGASPGGTSPAGVASPAAVVSPLEAASAGGSRAPLKDALLAEIRAGKSLFYNTVVAQAQRIEVVDERVTFTFSPNQRALKDQFEQARPWLQAAADRLAGTKVTLLAVHGAENGASTRPEPETPAPSVKTRDLKAEAMSSSAVQALLDVFPGEIRDVEDLGPS